jgi:hypothetical protein
MTDSHLQNFLGGVGGGYLKKIRENFGVIKLLKGLGIWYICEGMFGGIIFVRCMMIR